MARLLVAVHGYPPRHAGGAELRARRTAQAMAQRGHEVHVFCVEELIGAGNRAQVRTKVEGRVHVHRMSLPQAPPADAFRWSYDHPLVAEEVARLIEAHRPDLLHLFGGYLITSSAVNRAADRGLPVIVSLTDYWWLCHRINLLTPTGRRCASASPQGCARCHAELQRRFRLPSQHMPQLADVFWQSAAAERWPGQQLSLAAQRERAAHLASTLRRVAALIAPSHYLAGVYRDHALAGEGQLLVSRQGVDLSVCPLRRPADVLRVGYMGQIKPHKGVDLLLDAWGRLRGDRARRLVLYGSAEGAGDYGKRITRALGRLTGARWHGHIGGAELWQALAGLDLLVMPARWAENSPNVILEAQAMGVPVIGVDLGGVAELVAHERNGLLFPPDDATGLARQLQRVLDEPELLPQLQARALPFRSHQDEIAELERVYANLIGRRGGAGQRAHRPLTNNSPWSLEDLSCCEPEGVESLHQPGHQHTL